MTQRSVEVGQKCESQRVAKSDIIYIGHLLLFSSIERDLSFEVCTHIAGQCSEASSLFGAALEHVKSDESMTLYVAGAAGGLG